MFVEMDFHKNFHLESFFDSVIRIILIIFSRILIEWEKVNGELKRKMENFKDLFYISSLNKNPKFGSLEGEILGNCYSIRALKFLKKQLIFWWVICGRELQCKFDGRQNGEEAKSQVI